LRSEACLHELDDFYVHIGFTVEVFVVWDSHCEFWLYEVILVVADLFTKLRHLREFGIFGFKFFVWQKRRVTQILRNVTRLEMEVLQEIVYVSRGIDLRQRQLSPKNILQLERKVSDIAQRVHTHLIHKAWLWLYTKRNVLLLN